MTAENCFWMTAHAAAFGCGGAYDRAASEESIGSLRAGEGAI